VRFLIRCWDEIAYRDPARACLALAGIVACIAIISGVVA
jgi:hypothetical protein